jgi:hypothetical protein
MERRYSQKSSGGPTFSLGGPTFGFGGPTFGLGGYVLTFEDPVIYSEDILKRHSRMIDLFLSVEAARSKFLNFLTC